MIIDNALFQQTKGIEGRTINGVKFSPIEREEFVLKKVNAKGWSRAGASKYWDKLTLEHWDRDNKGEGIDGSGSRLWLPQDEYVDRQRALFASGHAVFNSATLHNVDDEGMAALEAHVHERAPVAGLGDRFFDGVVTAGRGRSELDGVVSRARSKSGDLGDDPVDDSFLVDATKKGGAQARCFILMYQG